MKLSNKIVFLRILQPDRFASLSSQILSQKEGVPENTMLGEYQE
jgi:hypothetical protein